MKHLGRVSDVSVRRGEVNQTVYRDFITDDPDAARLLKGVEVAQYRLKESLSQGEREWFDESRFLLGRDRWKEVSTRRIATQRITGVDERLRIVAAIVEPPCYFADSTNSVHLEQGSAYALEYIAALLNSKLFQWRFKLTSTNNNVGTNELDALPFRTIDFSDPAERRAHEQLCTAVQDLSAQYRQLAVPRTAHEQTVITRRISVLEGQIDRIVFQLYGLNEAEITLVERGTRPGGLHAVVVPAGETTIRRKH